jgi:hypothetical protein
MLDISLSPRRHRFCNGWSRRDFLRVGALGPLGLSLGQLLSAQAAGVAAATASGHGPGPPSGMNSSTDSRTPSAIGTSTFLMCRTE